MAADPVQSAPPPEPMTPRRKGLTRNERLVLDALGTKTSPMKAYELLEALKGSGVKAPMTVYRALDRLEERGLIHKLDAINAFVLCRHQTPHEVQAFLVCIECCDAQEIEDARLSTLPWEEMVGHGTFDEFDVTSTRIEIRGRCNNCT